MLVAAALLAGAALAMWLVVEAWRRDIPAPRAWTRLRDRRAPERPVPAAQPEPVARIERLLEEHGAAVATLHRAVDALGRDVLARQERIAADCARLSSDLAGRLDAMRSLLAQLEQTVPAPVLPAPRPAVAEAAPDVDAVYAELAAELRLEELDERERTLAELEQRLVRREQELALFVAQAQSRFD